MVRTHFRCALQAYPCQASVPDQPVGAAAAPTAAPTDAAAAAAAAGSGPSLGGSLRSAVLQEALLAIVARLFELVPMHPMVARAWKGQLQHTSPSVVRTDAAECGCVLAQNTVEV
jgi:hypothetical protein